MISITNDLKALAPPLFPDKATIEQYLQAIEATIATVASVTRLANSVAAMNDIETARSLRKALVPIIEHYENRRDWSGGTFNEADSTTGASFATNCS